VSDHGHADLHGHEDLSGLIASWGHSVREHPLIFGGRDVAVMVSGNAMAHLYLELHRTVRPGWEALRARWTPMLQQLLARESGDLAVVHVAPGLCEVHGRGRGHAEVRSREGRLSYHRLSGDPLHLGMDLDGLTANESWEATIATDYPDALVQVLAIADAPRAGDIILSAAPGWDLRTRWEPMVHASGHGALHREQMLVPLVMSRAPRARPRRTTDVFPSALDALGLAVPIGLDGESYR
jgi:arylsulfatase A-like enzyme